MLIEFSVENFRSFRDNVTLSMVATSDKSLFGNVVDCGRHGRCLRTAAIYGANASGKSNLVAAIQSMRNMVLTSHMIQKGFRMMHQPFKMDESCRGRPTRFEVVFTIAGVKYEYGFSHDSVRIYEEHLHAYPKGRRSVVFTRNDKGIYDFTKDVGRQEDIKEWTLPNALYLSIATQRSYEPAARAFEWFRDHLRVGMFPEGPRNTVEMILQSPHQKATIMKALSAADVGISDVLPEKKMLKLEETPIPSELRELLRGTGDGKFEAINVRSVHEVTMKGKKSRVIFDSSEESLGTMRIFEMIGPWIDAIQNGRVLVWDELDLRLHPFLSVFLIGLFQDSGQNKTDAQLIFTTHNTNLLDSDLLRRDQIWFTERDPDSGNSVLYSLVEFKPRKDKNLQIGYLSGRYGALPFIGTEKVI